MKLITAIVQPEAFELVKKALYEKDIRKMTVSNVIGAGQQGGYKESYRGTVVSVNLLKKIKIEIAVNDEFVKETVAAIVEAARTGNIGDGKIFVQELAECIRIRTGEFGQDAIG